MRKSLNSSMIAAAAIVLTLAESACAQSLWTKQTAPLMTPWSDGLTEENVWQEYPRPSMKRNEWMNLNGVWKYYKRPSIRYDYESNASSFSKAILVPFPVESALSGIMDKSYSSNRKATHMYRRTFRLSEAFSGKNTLLHFGAVDWRCHVYVNGQLAGTHDGGSVPFTFDITPYLKEEGEQELQVAVWDPTDGGQPNGKQSVSPSGHRHLANRLAGTRQFHLCRELRAHPRHRQLLCFHQGEHLCTMFRNLDGKRRKHDGLQTDRCIGRSVYAFHPFAQTLEPRRTEPLRPGHNDRRGRKGGR